MENNTLTVFISSPGDVAQERALTAAVIERLNKEFAASVRIEPIFWEHEPLRATESFQDGLPLPSEADIVVSILWTRLGTRLPANYKKKSGNKLPPTGTEFELQDAKDSFITSGSPDLLVYKKTEEPLISMRDKKDLRERLEQMEALDEFIEDFFYDDDGALKAAFHTFEKSSDFEPLVEKHLRKLVAQKTLSPTDKLTQYHEWIGDSPYRALDHFDLEHAPIFFGRGRAVSEAIDNLRRQVSIGKPFLLIQGMSGSGKSSLVRAGILPMLMQPGVIEGIGLWRYGILSPSEGPDDLLALLCRTLTQQNALPELVSNEDERAGLIRALSEDSVRLSTIVENALQQAAEKFQQKNGLQQLPRPRLVLILDQLEELFTIREIDDTARAVFIRTVSRLVETGLVFIIGTLRSDFYDRCEELDDLIELKKGYGQYHLKSPDGIEIGQMIKQPALAAGLSFEVDSETGVALDEILRDEAMSSPESLPLLEFTLEQLYQKCKEHGLLSFKAYTEIGQLRGALSQHADDVLNSLRAEVRAEFGTVIRKLVRVSQTDDETVVRRWHPLADLQDNALTGTMIEAFIKNRLCVTDVNSSGQASVSLSHEILLKSWGALQDLIAMDMKYLSSRSKLERFFQTWVKENQAADYLLPEGNVLAEAQELLDKRGAEIDPELKSYIQESSSYARLRYKRKLRVLSVVASLFGILALVAGWSAYKGYTGQKIAEKARDRAEKQKELALKAVKKMTYEVPDKLARISGTTRLLSEIFAENVLLLDKIYQLNPDNLSAQREKGVNLSLAGEKWSLLGDTGKAREAYDRALVIRTRLAEEYPDNMEAQRDLGVSYNNLGDLSLRLGDTGAAEHWYDKALSIRKNVVGRNPENMEAQRLLGFSYARRGDLQMRLGNMSAATGEFNEALRVTQALVLVDQGEPKTQENLAGIYTKLGKIYLRSGNHSEAENAYTKAFEIMRRLTLVEEGNTRHQRSLAYCYDNLGSLYLKVGDVDKAAQLFLQALELHRGLTEADLENSKGQIDLALAYLQVGDLHNRRQNYSEAGNAYREGLSIFSKLVTRDPLNSVLRVNQALLYERLGLMYQFQKENGPAGEYMSKAFVIRKELVEADPDDLELARDLSVSFAQLADLDRFAGQMELAEANYLKALEIRRKVSAADEKNDHVQRDMAVILCRLGSFYAEQSRIEKAEYFYQQGLEFQVRRGAANPESIDTQVDLISTYMDFAKLYAQSRRFQEASTLYKEAYQISKKGGIEETQGRNTIANSVRTALIHSLYMQVMYAGAEEDEVVLCLCRDILALDPTHIKALARQARIHESQRQLYLAEQDFRRICEVAPGKDVGWGGLARVLLLQNRPGEAVEAIKLAREIKPDHSPWLLYQGHYHLLNGEEDKAADYYQQAIDKGSGLKFLRDAERDLAYFAKQNWNMTLSQEWSEWFQLQYNEKLVQQH